MTSLWSWFGQRIGLGSRFEKFWASFAGGRSDADEIVTPDRALGITAMNRGIKLYAETISTLPLNTYENPPGGGDPVIVRDGNQYDVVMRISPNEDLTPVEFWEAMVASEVLLGNGYAEKIRVGRRLVALDFLDPNTTTPFREAGTFALRYRGVRQNGEPFNLPAADVFHLKGFSFGGDCGLSIVQLGANAIGNLISANKASGKMLRSGLSSSGFLEAPQVLNEPDRDKLTKIMEQYAGSDNAGKMMILEGGMKYNRLSMSAADAQLLMQIGFGIEEVARLLGIPPIMLGHNAAGQTMWGTGVESIVGTWYTLGLRARLKRIESAISKRLIEPADRTRFFAKFNVDALLRGDSAAQAALFSAAAQNGWLTRNEIRKLLDLPPMPGGDKLTVQVNMAILEDLGKADQKTVQQARAALRLLIGIDEEKPEPRKLAA